MDDSHGREWGLLALLWLLLVSITAYEIVPASVLSAIIADLGIGPAAGGWIVSALILAMAVMAIPGGIVLDYVDDRRAIAATTLALFVTTAWAWQASVAGAFLSLLVARFFGGAVIVILWTASVGLVGDIFPPERQATAIGILSTSIPGGFAVGQFTGPLIANAAGWPAIFPGFGAASTAIAAAFWIASRGVTSTPGSGDVPTRGDFERVLTDRRVWSVAVLGFVAFSLNLFFNSWMPTYLVDRFAMSLERSGLLAALFPAVGIVARATSGPLSDRVFDHRRRPVVLSSFLLTIPLVAVVGSATVVVVFLVALIAAGFVVQLGLALLFTYVRELVATNVAATALAVLNAVGFLGAFIAPVVAGELIELTGSFLPAFGYVGALAAVGTLVAWRAPEPDLGSEGAPKEEGEEE